MKVAYVDVVNSRVRFYNVAIGINFPGAGVIHPKTPEYNGKENVPSDTVSRITRPELTIGLEYCILSGAFLNGLPSRAVVSEILSLLNGDQY